MGRDITVNYRIEPGSATAGDDYNGNLMSGVILTAAESQRVKSNYDSEDDNVTGSA